MVIWIIGLPGSGKTTLAKELQKVFPNMLHIDGDDMREIWGSDIGYSTKDRRKNSTRIQKLAALFEKQGFIVVVSIMSIFQEHRDKNKYLYNSYLEIFLDVELSILKKRRKIYQDAIEKKISNVVGIDIPYEKPINSNIIFNNNFEINYMIKSIKEYICV
ncbi:adenylyl-sulfate kinase [Halarcobacter sp.]|uniref:adenylyl-sulfate kinase n=1 Tax=Halarcobacter sp. TaxID=2321133 RepID=UPI0029F55BDF|nr:adenylyl-sulfate kinase [Halarcobacter sp.]